MFALHVKADMKTIIHVNQHIIRSNKTHNLEEPVITVKQGSKNRYCKEVSIAGPSKIVYSPNDPLSCGARVWIETESDVTLLNEKKYKEIRQG